MLLFRSKCVQLLVLSLTLVNAQNYESEYDEDDHSSYTEHDKPDYSKYYSQDSSAPIVQAETDSAKGFVSPIDFSSFIGSNFDFEPSAKQVDQKDKNAGFVSPYELQSGINDFKTDGLFQGRDYFEEAQKQQSEPDVGKKNSYEVLPGPSYISHKVIPPTKKNVAKIVNYESEVKDLNKNYDYEPYKFNKEIKLDKENYGLEKQEPSVRFDFKQSHPSKPDLTYAPQAYATKPAQTLTPYQKYSFQPNIAQNYKSYAPSLSSNNFYNKYTSVLPAYEYSSPSETVSTTSNFKNCKKVYKPAKSKREAMDCYVCKDEKSGSNYEECSYGSKPEANKSNYYIETSSKYKEPTRSDSYRYKRYATEEAKEDPYERIKARSQEYYSKPKAFESEYYQPKEYTHEEYRFPASYFETEEKSSSEKVSEQLVKNGENCNKVVKDDMTCMVCKNSETGGNYEQCSYSGKPSNKKFAYSKERKYDSNDETPKEESTKVQPVKTPEEVEKIEPISTNKSDKIETSTETSKDSINSKLQEKTGESEYHAKYQPDESRRAELKKPSHDYAYYGAESKKDVSEVLAEFAKKDRSKCVKSEKNGMTCYSCTDKTGLQNEECMYVSESSPKSTYTTYHGKSVDPTSAESKLLEAPTKHKRFHKKLASEPESLSSSVKASYVKVKSDPETSDSSTDEYRVDGEGGAFSHETEPVYSKQLGFSLPKFMLVKTEGEKMYDQFVKG